MIMLARRNDIIKITRWSVSDLQWFERFPMKDTYRAFHLMGSSNTCRVVLQILWPRISLCHSQSCQEIGELKDVAKSLFSWDLILLIQKLLPSHSWSRMWKSTLAHRCLSSSPALNSICSSLQILFDDRIGQRLRKNNKNIGKIIVWK